jgi:hypothetical protein
MYSNFKDMAYVQDFKDMMYVHTGLQLQRVYY